jgi:chemotaxis protein MotB
MLASSASRRTITLLFLLGLVSACASKPSPPSPLDLKTQQLQSLLAGAPVTVTEGTGQIMLTAQSDALYPKGGWQLKPGAPVLTKMLPALTSLQHTKIVVNGYTDNTPIGPDLQRQGISNNIDLSSKRAGAVVTFLSSHGVNPNLLSAQGFGDTHPVAPNDTADGRAKNRRVEIVLIGDGT